MNKTMRELGRLEAVESLLQHKFGPLPDVVRERLRALPEDRAQQRLVQHLTATSRAELGLADLPETKA